MQPHLAKDRLHHFHTGPAIMGVQHDCSDTVGSQNVGERLHPDLRLGQVMEHTG